MRECNTCKESKPLEQFYKRDSFRYYHKCKSCHISYLQDRNRAKKIWAIEYMGGKCSDCEKVYDYCVYDFHHLSNKDADWRKLRHRSTDKIKKELEKCVLLCSNCHRMRHSSDEYLSKEDSERILSKKGKVKKKTCSECSGNVSYTSASGMCRQCYDRSRGVTPWPSDEELINMKNEGMTFAAIGRKLKKPGQIVGRRFRKRKLL